MDRNEFNSWSIEDSECSNDGQGSKSINTQLDSLRLSSLESYKSEEDIISRGNGKLYKSHPTNRNKQKNGTSSFVMNVIDNLDSSKSSGYSSDNTTTTTTQTYEKPFLSANVPPILEEKQLKNMSKKVAGGKAVKKLLESILEGRQKKKKSKDIDISQWIFDFDDTNLIKSCRRGQLQGVQKSINELIENQQLDLINHKNSANETALSIVTYQMSEILIDLLLQHGALPTKQLTMKNNVLHIAADLTPDHERKTFGYLLNGIRKHQSNYLWETIRAKNIFKCDPLDILRLHRDSQSENYLSFHQIDHRINEALHLINALYNHFSLI